jgi:predicted MFS family arabinose efflux permease
VPQLRAFTPLRHRGFRYLAAGQLTSSLGDACYTVALPWYVLAARGSPLLLGTALAAYGIARIALLAVGGRASDRWGPWTVMITADIARLLAIAALALASASRPAGVGLLIPIAVLLGAGGGLFLPSALAIVPALLPGPDLQSGNALASASVQFAALIGPALGGAIVALTGPPPAFWIDAASFAVSVATLTRIRALQHASTAAPYPSGVSQPGQDIRQADTTRPNSPQTTWQFVRSTRVLQIVLLVTFTANLGLGGQSEVALPALAHGPLEASADGYGGLLAAFSAGALIGTMLAGHARLVRRPALVGSLAYLTAAGCLAAVPYLGGIIPAGVALANFGALVSIGNIILITAFQRWAPPAIMGRLMSLLLLASFGAFPISAALGGVIVRHLGPAPFFPLAAVGITASIAVALSYKQWREFGASPITSPQVTDTPGAHQPLGH